MCLRHRFLKSLLSAHPDENTENSVSDYLHPGRGFSKELFSVTWNVVNVCTKDTKKKYRQSFAFKKCLGLSENTICQPYGGVWWEVRESPTSEGSFMTLQLIVVEPWQKKALCRKLIWFWCRVTGFKVAQEMIPSPPKHVEMADTDCQALRALNVDV